MSKITLTIIEARSIPGLNPSNFEKGEWYAEVACQAPGLPSLILYTQAGKVGFEAVSQLGRRVSKDLKSLGEDDLLRCAPVGNRTLPSNRLNNVRWTEGSGKLVFRCFIPPSPRISVECDPVALSERDAFGEIEPANCA